MKLNKKELKQKFQEEWEKHYKLEILEEKGFKRQRCKKCGNYFWSQEERDFCADSACIGYEFIGNPPSSKKLSYIETWKIIKKYFTSHGHGYVAPYPTVARWRDDLYFTIASINNFQPYVVNGEIDPPANPLIVPQPCLRFGDIDNVGITGRHYTNFVMIGQHAFNTEKTGLFYWKNEAIEHDINYLKELGINENDIIFIEEVWVGGGNFGPSLEYFSRGLELGNCVFMQFEINNGNIRELKTKVIDMGAGLSRLAWITHGSPTSYEIVFGEAVEKLKKEFNISIDNDLFIRYSKLSGSLNIDEVRNIEEEKERISKLLGTTKEELFTKLEPLQAIYAIADHTLTSLFAITDGMLPSNSGGGYNLRLILRRAFALEQRNGWKIDYYALLSAHVSQLREMFPNLEEGLESAYAIIEDEKNKYLLNKEKSKQKVTSLLKSGKEIALQDLKTLYVSHGIPPEYVVEVAKELNINLSVPGNFYEIIRKGDEIEKKEENKIVDLVDIPKTEILYYTREAEFKAKVIAIKDNYLILDRSAFYPEGGGQVSDTGLINSKKVKNVIKSAGIILHEVEDINSFKVGMTVNATVDIERRKSISRNHIAAHMINAAAQKILGKHIWQAGSYKDENKGHIDLTHYKRITNDELNAIEMLVNKWILENRKIIVEVLPKNVAEELYGFRIYQGGAIPGKDLRIVKIENVDVQACGGTHHMLNSTSEIGIIKIIKRESIQDGVERIIYTTGLKAISYIQQQEEYLRTAAEKISVSPHELANAVENFFNEWKARGKKISALLAILAEREAKQIIEEFNNKEYVIRIYDEEKDFLLSLAQKLSNENVVAALINKNKDIVCIAGKGSNKNANLILNEFISKYGGKGGGNERIAIGRLENVPT